MAGLDYDHATREWRKAKSAVDNWRRLREAAIYRLHEDGMTVGQIMRETEITRDVVQRIIRKVRRELEEMEKPDAEVQG